MKWILTKNKNKINEWWQVVGGRSPYRCDYKIGVMKDGRITSLQLKILNNHVSFSFSVLFNKNLPSKGS
jgi:xanthine dehydrogenase molybdopterin-binding subunit B